MDPSHRERLKRVRRVVLFAVVISPVFYFAPLPVLFFILCGALDVGRHRKITYQLIERYFTGNGFGTWLMSPVNLLIDLISDRNPGTHRLDDLPSDHRRETEACVQAFIANGDLIKSHLEAPLERNRRCMLTFKWFGGSQATGVTIPAFERDYRYIKTIAVSAFRTRERTTWHFGPLRLTYRVLYNLEPIASKDVFIQVDDATHYWSEDPLFIFDDTRFHRSVNDVDHSRYCLFMDIVRPNHFETLFGFAVSVTGVIAGLFKRIFYNHWTFVR